MLTMLVPLKQSDTFLLSLHGVRDSYSIHVGDTITLQEYSIPVRYSLVNTAQGYKNPGLATHGDTRTLARAEI